MWVVTGKVDVCWSIVQIFYQESDVPGTGDTAMNKSYQNLCLMVFMSAILWSYRSKVRVSRVSTLIR